MLHNTESLFGRRLAATDGEIGEVEDFYFDDQTWAARYLLADTGTWLAGRKVLLPSLAFGDDPFQDSEHLRVNLSRKQIEDSPPITDHQTVSRQYEVDFYNHYGWPGYWLGGGMWDAPIMPAVMPIMTVPPDAEETAPREEDRHLRSMKELAGYAIHATDGEIGTVSGFMLDDQTWSIREIAVESGHWYAGKLVYLLVENVTEISYPDSSIFVNLTMEDIRETAENHVVHV